MPLTLGKANGKDAQFDVASLTQLFATGDDGGAGGDHIVDDEQVLALNGFGIA